MFATAQITDQRMPQSCKDTIECDNSTLTACKSDWVCYESSNAGQHPAVYKNVPASDAPEMCNGFAMLPAVASCRIFS